LVTRGFFGKGNDNLDKKRLPPGQYLENRFPVLSAEPTPDINLLDWKLSFSYNNEILAEIDWNSLIKIESTELTKDIHCVTRWTKFDMNWKGVSVQNIIKSLDLEVPSDWVMIGSSTGYTTNLPIEDLLREFTLIAYEYEKKPITPEHGGPIRLLVPHLYFWKSAKWVSSINFIDEDKPGFWENYGYHMYGDPWKEQRYS
jgi:DMSO/TMAO reductase YedYZ molybdopterin-dependent catalytic subunit|tara:strand:- start:1437 stop:2036 length:600 start_codon:yes stop_codon:yes gene_type:complete